MILAVAIQAPHPLVQPHGIPWDVVIDDDVAELQVQTLAASVGGDENADILGERFLHLLILLKRKKIGCMNMAILSLPPLKIMFRSNFQINWVSRGGWRLI